MSPRWKVFKGLKLLHQDKIWLKAAIWRAQDLQYLEKRRNPTCNLVALETVVWRGCPVASRVRWPVHAAHRGNGDVIQPTLAQLHPNSGEDFTDTPDLLSGDHAHPDVPGPAAAAGGGPAEEPACHPAGPGDRDDGGPGQPGRPRGAGGLLAPFRRRPHPPAPRGAQGPPGLLQQPVDGVLPGRGGLAGATGGHPGGGLDPGIPDAGDAGGDVRGRAPGGRCQGAAAGDAPVPGADEPPAPPATRAGTPGPAPGPRVPVPRPAAQRHLGLRGQRPQRPVPAGAGGVPAQRLPAGPPRPPRLLDPAGPPGLPQPRLHVARLARPRAVRGDAGRPGPAAARPRLPHLFGGPAPKHPLAAGRPRRGVSAPAWHLLHPGGHPPVVGWGGTGVGVTPPPHPHGNGWVGGCLRWGYTGLGGGPGSPPCQVGPPRPPHPELRGWISHPFTLVPTDGNVGY